MDSISATTARQRWAETIDAAQIEPVTITQHGRPVAVVMSTRLAQAAIEALEEFDDIRAANKARSEIEAGAPTVPWEQVRAELGLDDA